MACGKTNKGVTRRLITTTTEPLFEPYSDWMPAIGVDSAKMVIKRKSVSTTGTNPALNVKPAIQVALVRPDNPDAWTAIAGVGPYTGAGESNTSVMNIASTTGGKMFVRFGVSYYLSGDAPTTGQADVEMILSYKQCGEIVGSMTQELQAFNTTSDSFVAVTGWIPAMDADKVVAAFVISDIANNFQCQLAYRKAATSIQNPSAWSLLEGASYRNSNGETTTGEVALSIGGEIYVQFGIAFSQSSAGSAPGQATVSTATAVRRS